VLTKKKRISKKEIKQDKLVNSYYKVLNFYQKYQAKVIIGLAAFALVVIAIILYSNKSTNDNLAAANLLSKVIPIYQSGSYEEAINGLPTANIVGLKEIVDNYGGTEQGESAKIYLANAYIVTNNIEEAFKLFDDYSGSNPLFKATSLAGRASYYEIKKEYEKAADLYKDASRITISNPSNPEFLLKAGINLLKLGRKEEAKAVFLEIKSEYKSAPTTLELDRYLVQTEN